MRFGHLLPLQRLAATILRRIGAIKVSSTTFLSPQNPYSAILPSCQETPCRPSSRASFVRDRCCLYPGVKHGIHAGRHQVIPIKSSNSSGLSVLRRRLPLSRLFTVLAAVLRLSLCSSRFCASSASAWASSSFSLTVRGEEAVCMTCQYDNPEALRLRDWRRYLPA